MKLSFPNIYLKRIKHRIKIQSRTNFFKESRRVLKNLSVLKN